MLSEFLLTTPILTASRLSILSSYVYCPAINIMFSERQLYSRAQSAGAHKGLAERKLQQGYHQWGWHNNEELAGTRQF